MTTSATVRDLLLTAIVVAVILQLRSTALHGTAPSYLSEQLMYVCMYIRLKQLTNRNIDNTDNKRKSKR